MIDMKYIRENPEIVRANCHNRGAKVDIDRLLELDAMRRKMRTETDALLSERNTLSKSKPTPEQIARVREINDTVAKQEGALEPIEAELKKLWYAVPNHTHPAVHVSDNEDDNPVLEMVGAPRKFDFRPLDHVELAEKLDLIDFDRGTKVSGAKFYYFKNEVALLEFALVQYALQTVMKHWFTPIITPDLAKQSVLEGLGFQPRGESTQTYNIENTDLSLVGTAEATMGGYHMDETLNATDLPKKYVAVSHCFRTEAGATTKFSKGIFRVHQFTKVEMFQYVMPDQSEAAHKELLAIEKEIFSGLEIPFRVVDHCTADLGGPSIRTYDLEAWMPGKPAKNGSLGDWGEITSTSNCTDFQARGLNIKYKDASGKKEFLHMLNGTAVSICRAIVAFLENHQQADGTIRIPVVLQPYMGGISVIKR